MISPAKQQERIKYLSAIAAKVFSAVPISEPWSVSRIYAEMQRSSGSTKDQRIIHGCLNSLKESGLIEEPERNIFVRCPVRQISKESEIQPPEKEKTTMPAPAAKQPRPPLVILSELATRCKALADSIETAALEIDEYVTAKDVDAGKLKQLQALLKGLA